MESDQTQNVRLDIEAALDRLEFGSIIIKIARHKIVHIDFIESKQYGKVVVIPEHFTKSIKDATM